MRKAIVITSWEIGKYTSMRMQTCWNLHTLLVRVEIGRYGYCGKQFGGFSKR